MLDPKFLPDQELAKATNGNGPIPSWLALATLHSRNNMRSSAPTPAPQGTVAQDVVGQALRSAGMQQQPQPSAPTGIMGSAQPQQPTQNFSNGGIVKLASGGNPIMDTLRSSGVIPSTDPDSINYTPVEYHPAVAPDATTLDDAGNKIGKLFGKGPDYDSTIAATRNARVPKENQGLGNWLSNFVSGAAGSTQGNAVNAFGRGMATADRLAEEGRQQNFHDTLAKNQQVFGMQRTQDERQQRIAESTMQYRNANAQIADLQAREQAEVARGNSQGAMEVAQERAKVEAQKATAVDGFLKGMGNPMFAAAYGKMAEQRGDSMGAQLAKDSIEQHRQQQQQSEDIQTSGQMKVAQAHAAADLRNRLAEQAAAHQYKMQETGMAMMLGPDGKMDGKLMSSPYGAVAMGDVDPAATGSMSDLKGVDANKPLDAAAVHWILTNEVPFKGQGASGMNIAMQNRAHQIMAANGIKPDELTPIRSQFKANSGALGELTKKSQNLQMSEDRIDRQLPNLERAVKGSNYGAPILNGPINNIASMFGGTGKIDRDSAINPVVTEYANFMGGANKGATDAATEHARELLPNNATPEMAKKAIANLRKEMEAQVGAGNDSVSSQVQRTKLMNIVGAIRGSNPDHGVTVPGHIQNGQRQAGETKNYNGRTYKFDGHQWVAQ